MRHTHLPFKALPMALCAAIVFTAVPASAAHAQDLHLRYQAYWSGLHVADFSLSLINGGDTYENRFHLESRGMTRFFTNMAARATSRGRIIAPPPSPQNGTGNAAAIGLDPTHLAPTYLAQSYRTEYTNSKHFRWVNITFGEAGESANAVTGTKPIAGREDKWNPDEKGPEVLERVDAEQRIGVSDPITVIPQMIAMVRAHLLGGPKSHVVKGFDGRRRFDLDITYLGQATRTVGNTDHDTYHVRVVPHPVAGFKDRHKMLWKDSAYDFYLSHDARMVPLQIVPLKHGPVLTLTEECAVECQVPEDDS